MAIDADRRTVKLPKPSAETNWRMVKLAERVGATRSIRLLDRLAEETLRTVNEPESALDPAPLTVKLHV